MTKMVGVALVDRTEGVTTRSFVHQQRDGWVVTSATPPDQSILDVDTLETCLPGFLGTYVYPRDAVFHKTTQTITTLADLDREMQVQRETHVDRVRRMLRTRMNHHTIVHQESDVVEEQGNEECERDDEVEYDEDKYTDTEEGDLDEECSEFEDASKDDELPWYTDKEDSGDAQSKS